MNESLANNNVPFEVVKAYVGEINLSIPWTSLLSENSMLDIKDLEITIRPKQTMDPSNDQRMKFLFLSYLSLSDVSDNSFELSTMFNSMNTSMLIAQECLKNEPEEDTTYLGLENFAAAIDSSKRKTQTHGRLSFPLILCSSRACSCHINRYCYSIGTSNR